MRLTFALKVSKKKIHKDKNKGIKQEAKLKWTVSKIKEAALDEFLFSTEKHWPKDIKYCQEHALHFLYLNNFDVNNCINIIKSNNTFKAFLEDNYS